ncbi:unnamed protein product [Heligmosomoides polygyrus]|uniref:Uncharacterized protein n=1 Tax=Heligmosomoides polygyrus TaxID=6339 RepID=A0A183G6E2_HELPZ|nr:unnamed protein product [Heligmosomoides polygyrus]
MGIVESHRTVVFQDLRLSSGYVVCVLVGRRRVVLSSGWQMSRRPLGRRSATLHRRRQHRRHPTIDHLAVFSIS